MHRLFLLALLAAAPALQAQAPYLVRDVNTTYATDTESSNPLEFVHYRGRTYFVATTDEEDRELWSTDGTAAGTARVADVVPGSSGSNPTGLRVVNGLLLFSARTVDHGVELWRTDGTAAGTQRVLDINPGPSSSSPGVKFVHGDRMIFAADDGTHGRELWVTDGTAAGTRLLEDVNPGSGSSNPAYPVLFNGSVHFAALGLWKTDGTDAGTVKVASGPTRSLIAAGNQLFFEGHTSATNWELWVSDGTEAGTRMVADILPGNRSSLAASFTSQPYAKVVLGDRVIFPANDDVHGRELWISDGTAAGTRMIRNLFPGKSGIWDQSFPSLIAFRGRVYFAAFADSEHGEELWVTDGSEAGTTLFADLLPGTRSSTPFGFVVAGEQLFFGAYTAPLGSRLWVTDGSAGGLRVVAAADGTPFGFGSPTAVGGTLYFAGESALHGTEPWVSDGTDAGTRLIANLQPDAAPSARPRKLTAAGGLLFFHATEGVLSPKSNIAEASLWRSDGTAVGTFKLRETGQHPPDLLAAGPLVFFDDPERRSTKLLSDGTAVGTTSADAFLRRFGGFDVEELFPFGDTLFARVEDRGIYETTLWKTTAALDAPAVALGGRDPKDLIEVAGRWFFNTEESSPYDRGLWSTGGTPAGTYAVVPDLGGEIGRLASAAGLVFYAGTYDGKSYLWKSDGTLGGTVPVREIPGPVREIEGAGRQVFLVVDRGVWDHVLWVSDGTAEGTIELMDLEQRPSNARDLLAIGNRIVFSQRYENGVYELWSSDGTKSGTVALMRGSAVFPGAASIDGLVYFAGHDAAHGTELWVTDGTAEGTKLLFDLEPGPASSRPAEFTRAGDTLYFRASTAATGDELWALPLVEPRLTVSDARAAENETARFTVTLSPAPRQSVTVAYATADRTARAGEDYDAAAGTLTFAPGETARSIDVRLRADATIENNETFFLTLRNAGGASIARNEGVGVVEDDDQAADLAVTAPFLGQTVLVSNSGPSPATNVDVRITATPEQTTPGCRQCKVPQIMAGASASAGDGYWTPPAQSYLSAVVRAREADPRPSNNATTWTISPGGSIAMTPAYLTPGASGTVTTLAHAAAPAPFVSSTDPSVVAVTSEVTRSEHYFRFQVTALKPGTASITVAGTSAPLLVTVVAAGITPRWPGALQIERDYTAVDFDQPMMLTIHPSGQAPISGARATGMVAVVMPGGEELARHPVDGTARIRLPVWFRALGSINFSAVYSGDDNFLPQTQTFSVYVHRGRSAIIGSLRAAGSGAFDLQVAVEGSPVVPPTGSIVVRSGGNEIARVSLEPASGKSVARVRLTNLPASPVVTVAYLGDAYHAASSQQIRSVLPKRRTVRP